MELFQTVGVVGGLFYTARAMRLQAKAQIIESRFHQIERQAAIQEALATRPELARIHDPHANLAAEPVSNDELRFVKMMISHLYGSYFAMKNGALNKPDGLELDIKTFFALPIPKAIWRQLRVYQDKDFRHWVERAMGV